MLAGDKTVAYFPEDPLAKKNCFVKLTTGACVIKICNVVMEQHIMKIAIEYRGRHKKGITTFNDTENSLQQKYMFELHKCWRKMK
jgi:hypothetical protein